ncbi:MAG: UDP-N-acetylmuramoyl-tripeptide--D-alanyl-D-alanine ligase [Bacillota bacterium]|nr:UDP-N-acetylmuramoyl-tripeptide--D-alanyl-D-alanine ligase [Bacillota bacterium]
MPFVNFVNTPIENAVSAWYVSDAKRIISGQSSLTVIGITGSYGKTSNKYILHRILSEKFNVLMTPESYNTTMGVVRTIREQLKPSHNIFIAEMGAKKRGDIKEICDIVHPTYGLITSIGPAHLESFKTIENTAAAKFELVDALPDSGVAFLNYSNDIIKNKSVSKKVISYGIENNTLSFWAENIEYVKEGLTFTLKSSSGLELSLKTKLLGENNVVNITGAASIALTLGIEPESVAFAVSKLVPVTHRLELKHSAAYTVIDDAFNSNPSGASEALNVLSRFKDKKRILITPGMVELGTKEYELNKEFGKHAADCCDIVIPVGIKRSIPIVEGLREGGFDEEHIHVVKNLNEALEKLKHIADADSIVLFENDLPDNYEEN